MSERERRIRRDHEGPWKSSCDESRTDYEDTQYLTEVIDRLRAENANLKAQILDTSLEAASRDSGLTADEVFEP